MPPLSPSDWARLGAAVVLVVTFVGVAVGRYPRLRMNRATIALVGAVVLVGLGAVPLERAGAAVDLDTLALLLGMMVLNANLRLAGFFRLVAAWLAERAHSPRQLLLVLVVASGALSALFLNDTVVLALVPLVLEVTAVARLAPVPYLVALVTAANVGSVATLVGNPQNMLIGVSSDIPFLQFSAALGPVAVGGLAIVYGVVATVYRRQLAARPAPALAGGEAVRAQRVVVFRPLLRKSLAATALLVVAMAAGVPPALAALGAASLLLVTRRVRPERVFRELDWSLLVFFAALFVVTAAVEETGATAAYGLVAGAAETSLASFVAISAVLSNLVSNVPAVMLLRPAIESLPDAEPTWLALAMATTLAGNLTLLGSVANLIVAETAARHRVRLSFVEYLKAGVPITLLTLGWGALWLALRA